MYSKQQKWESSTCGGIMFVAGSGMFPDMSFYTKRNRIGPHYKPSKSGVGI